jgi:hypothetical protein
MAAQRGGIGDGRATPGDLKLAERADHGAGGSAAGGFGFPRPRGEGVGMWGSTTDGKLIAGAIVVAAILVVWAFRYENFGPNNNHHRNRLTGATCLTFEGCWFGSLAE